MTGAPARSAGVGLRVALLIAPKALTNLMVGGLFPAVCFLVARQTWGLVSAVALTAAWNCWWQAVRWFQKKPFSGLLLVGLLELGLRTTVGLALHSARLFFLAPAVATALTGVAYIGSSCRPRPLLAGVLADLVPSSLVDLAHPRVQPVIRAVSILYGTEQIVVAAVSVLMVLTLTTPEYVAAHLVVSWSVFGAALVVCIARFRRDLLQMIPTSHLIAPLSGASSVRSVQHADERPQAPLPVPYLSTA